MSNEIRGIKVWPERYRVSFIVLNGRLRWVTDGREGISNGKGNRIALRRRDGIEKG